jgi:hypothetical protein
MGEDKQRVAEKNLGLFANAGGASPSGFLVPSNALTVGPEEPGPGDEWEFPTNPVDGAGGENVPTTELAQSTVVEAHRLDR